MGQPIELILETHDGTIDCRMEPETTNGISSYSVTILYPQQGNGYSRSEIFCYNMQAEADGVYRFAMTDDGIHPKIRVLEVQLASAIAAALRKTV